MKTLLLSASDTEGGAARAAIRLHQGLCHTEHTSTMLVQMQYGNHVDVIGPRISSGTAKIITGSRLVLDKLPLSIARPQNKSNFSLQWIPNNISAYISTLEPDIINLHWINNGFINIEFLRKVKVPMVWTLHDMWAFTGGCHYSQGCERYHDSCGFCPQLSSNNKADLSSWVWGRKKKAWKDVNITLVSPSNWLAQCARSSSIFSDSDIEVIPNGINTNIYKPIEKYCAREILGLPKDKKIILFGALSATSDQRKGYHYLESALKVLQDSPQSNEIELVVLGASASNNESTFSLRTHFLGTLKDDYSLATVYSAADLFISPSIQENLPNTIMEALSCGIPCVAFDVGGIQDMIDHQVNGYLASPLNFNDLVNGILWILEDESRYKDLSHSSRNKALTQFSQSLQSERYLSLFTRVLYEDKKH